MLFLLAVLVSGSSRSSFTVQRFWTADRTANSTPLSEPSTRIIGSEKDAADLMVETHDATNPDNETAIVHQEEEQFEWREVFRGECLYFEGEGIIC